ncbi:MAG: hypothetical protein DRQ37_06895 [Gammaproteobacteria bacterium]|nr:MAG: hypothetical protein DRQ37_06895 [Gammaproteobacteria bacterium]
MFVTDELVCWKCGADLDWLPLPIGRYAQCRACEASLHACRLCEFYDTRVAKHCQEPIAEEVKDKERANFCDYLSPMADAHAAGDDSPARNAEAALADLFGVGDDSTTAASRPAQIEKKRKAAKEDLNALFGIGEKSEDP